MEEGLPVGGGGKEGVSSKEAGDDKSVNGAFARSTMLRLTL